MAKKAAPAPESSEQVEKEVVTSTVPESADSPETEATTSTVIDQPAVSDDASASPSSPAEEPAAEPMKAGGGFDSPFAEPAPALTMVQRIEALEARVSALEG